LTEPVTLSEAGTGLLDTSVFIAQESGRPMRRDLLPPVLASTVITFAELSAGTLAAQDSASRARRMRTLTEAASLTLLEVDIRAAEYWAQLRVHLVEAGRRVPVNDLWIAAIALTHRLPIVTQDQDFEALAELPGITLIHL
jgi:predicted nucleic acid-binding protein